MKMEELPSKQYRIDKGIPIPESRQEHTSPLYRAVKTMEVGDSIVLPYQRKGITHNLSRATGFKFTQAKISDTEMRLWRTE